MREIEVYIDTEEIEEFLFNKLIKDGLVPSENELTILSNLFFDFLIHKKIIDDEYEEYE